MIQDKDKVIGDKKVEAWKKQDILDDYKKRRQIRPEGIDEYIDVPPSIFRWKITEVDSEGKRGLSYNVFPDDLKKHFTKRYGNKIPAVIIQAVTREGEVLGTTYPKKYFGKDPRGLPIMKDTGRPVDLPNF